MRLDSSKKRDEGAALTPMGIAQHPLFTAREKIDLLRQIKAGLTDASDTEQYRGFSADEIDEAIAEVQRKVQEGGSAGIAAEGDL